MPPKNWIVRYIATGYRPLLQKLHPFGVRFNCTPKIPYCHHFWMPKKTKYDFIYNGLQKLHPFGLIGWWYRELKNILITVVKSAFYILHYMISSTIKSVEKSAIAVIGGFQWIGIEQVLQILFSWSVINAENHPWFCKAKIAFFSTSLFVTFWPQKVSGFDWIGIHLSKKITKYY